MRKTLTILTLILLSGCMSKQNNVKKISLIYCPESNNSLTFRIPEVIVSVFTSKKKNDTMYEIISDSTISMITSDFENPVKISIMKLLKDSPNKMIINDFISKELGKIDFTKKPNIKYTENPSNNQIFIFYNPQNKYKEVANKYFVKSEEEINNIIIKHIHKNLVYYLFNNIIDSHTRPSDHIVILPPVNKIAEKAPQNKLSVQNQSANTHEKKFKVTTLRIEKSSDGNLLTWKTPLDKKDLQSVKYSLIFYDSENEITPIHSVSLENVLSFDVSTLRSKFINHERPKNGIDVKIIATAPGYLSITEKRHLSLTNKLKIFNCD